MTQIQKIIKYVAMAFAIFLVAVIIGGILSAIGLIGLFGQADAVTEQITVYPVSDQVTALKIQINAADLTVYSANRLTVESNLKNLEVAEKDGVLIIREKSRIAKNYNGAVLKVGIPETLVFTNVELETGAGRVTADALRTEKFTLGQGAGEVQIQYLEVTTETQIEGGAGKITVSDGVLHNLEMELGVGEMNLTCAILGNSDLNLGVGETNLVLLGAESDYRIEMERGIGSVTVNGSSMENGTYGSGENCIDIEGGVGALKVTFKAKDKSC